MPEQSVDAVARPVPGGRCAHRHRHLPGEIYKPPIKWTKQYFNLQQYRVHHAGGHFAPLEVPDIYVDDVRTFFRQFR